MSCLKLFLVSGLVAAVLLLTIDDLEQAVRLGGRFVTRRRRRLAESRGNETGKMGPMGRHGGNVSNVSNATESPWPEDYFPEIFATDFKTRNALPFVHYNGCRHCAEHAFCNYASNPGCGGSAANGVVTFRNIRHARGCRVKPVLSIPRSYIRDLDDLRSKPGTYNMLKSMLHSGFSTYRSHGHSGPVQQCIHQSWAVSVRWVHLHSFCTGARFDGMPGGSSLCATMNSHDDAGRIARSWSR